MMPSMPVTHCKSTAEITFSLTRDAHVSLAVYDVAGQEVRALVNGTLPAGTRTLTWDGTNDNGERVSSGVYFYRIVAGEDVATDKIQPNEPPFEGGLSG